MSLNLSAASSGELVGKLRELDISVPARTGGRKTPHTERWVIARALSTLAKADALEFPLAVTHRDRPDVHLVSGGTEIGIEITEAISKQYAAYCALAEREFPDVFLEPALFRWGAPDMTTAEMRELLRQGRLTTDGWVGDGVEREWALFIESVIATKQAKLARDGFEKFPSNWLAIYDNLPLADVYLERAVAFLAPRLEEHWSDEPSFDLILVEHGPVILHLSREGSMHLELNDLWD